MNKHIVFLFFLLVSVALYANNNQKYLAGAVPEVDGRVVFSKSISVDKSISDDKLFELMNAWAVENYSDEGDAKNRIVLSDPQKKDIACVGEKSLIFKSTALSLDRAIMSYQLIIEVDNQVGNVSLRNIKYLYNESRKETLFPAEELIIDKIALNKDGSKLNRYYDKFRTHTVDSVKALFNSIERYLNKNISGGSVVTPQHNQAVVTTSDVNVVSQPLIAEPVSSDKNSVMPGYRNISADKIPGNIIKLLNDWTLITSGNLNVNTMTASWGGLGVLWGKSVAFSFINPTRHSINTMDEGETYTIGFFTEVYKDALQYCGTHSGRNEDKIKGSELTLIKTPSGASAFSEAWMIIECKKILAQPISAGAVIDKESVKKWSENGYHKMYVGEILNVWVK